jgi:hypothetical protein
MTRAGIKSLRKKNFLYSSVVKEILLGSAYMEKTPLILQQGLLCNKMCWICLGSLKRLTQNQVLVNQLSYEILIAVEDSGYP